MVDVDYNADTWSGQLKYGSNLGGRAGTSLGATYLQAVTPRLSLGGEVGAHVLTLIILIPTTLRCVTRCVALRCIMSAAATSEPYFHSSIAPRVRDTTSAAATLRLKHESLAPSVGSRGRQWVVSRREVPSSCRTRSAEHDLMSTCRPTSDVVLAPRYPRRPSGRARRRRSAARRRACAASASRRRSSRSPASTRRPSTPRSRCSRAACRFRPAPRMR